MSIKQNKIIAVLDGTKISIRCSKVGALDASITETASALAAFLGFNNYMVADTTFQYLLKFLLGNIWYLRFGQSGSSSDLDHGCIGLSVAVVQRHKCFFDLLGLFILLIIITSVT